MKVEKLAYELYLSEMLHTKNDVKYTKKYFYKEIKNNEYYLSFYNKALKTIKKEKMKELNQFF